MKIHLIEHDPGHSPTNIEPWARKRGHSLSKTEIFRGEPFPAADTYDWLMVMGGSQHAWEEPLYPWLVSEKEGIAQALARKKIILGICFGAQLLAEALGGKVFPNRQKEIGWYPVVQTPEGRSSVFFQDIPERFTTFHWHSDHFDLPAGAVRLAFNDCSTNQAFIHPEYPLLVLQFHPEYTREMVRHYAQEFGSDWPPGPFVAGKGKTLTQTESLPDTYGLMEKILDNMVKAFGLDP